MLVFNGDLLLLLQGHVDIPPLSQLNAVGLQVLDISQVVDEVGVILDLAIHAPLAKVRVMSPVFPNAVLVDWNEHELLGIQKRLAHFL